MAGRTLRLLALSPGVQGASNSLIAGAADSAQWTFRWCVGNYHGNERNLQTAPSLESIAEFKVLANGGSRSSAAAPPRSSWPSRWNQRFHGSLIYFNRNRVTAENNFFSNRAGLPRPKSIGTSMADPWEADSGRQIFFFGNFEGFRQTASATITTQMPTVALRNGDFTGLAPIRDPFNGGVPFPDNRIPPIALAPYRKAWIHFLRPQYRYDGCRWARQ